MARTPIAIAAVAALAALALGTDAAPGGGAPTRITIWGAPRAQADALGGATYGGPTGALISERREVELGGGELRIAGVAATLDPASVNLRDLTEPGVAIAEQRFVPGAATPTELLARHVGDAVTLVTAKGEVAGVLRAADEHTLVVELGAGDQRRLSVMRRDYVQDVRLPAGAEQPSLVWRVAAKKPGKHAVELAYRASGLTWTADYLAILDEQARSVDFSAWATIKNATGATFDRAELTLVAGGGPAPGPAIAALAAAAPGKPAPGAPPRFAVPSPVRLGAGDAVQVELVPAHTAAKAQPVVSYEPMEDPSAAYQEFPNTDCTENSANSGGTSELALEVAVASQGTLPEGRVRLFRRQADRLELVSEDQLRGSVGLARIKLSGDTEITGERKQVSCTVDERAKTIHEKVTIRVENKGKQAVEVAIREYLWRWPVWKIEAEDRKGTRTDKQAQEYRVRVPAAGAATVTYAIVYSW